MNTKLIGIVGVVVVLVVAAIAVLSTKNTTQNNTSAVTNPNPTAAQAVEEQSNSTDVTVTANGFEPKEITIKAGDKVTWTNESGTKVTVNSAVHPTHLLWPFLNLGSFENGQVVSVVFEKAGTYKYHNHFNASQVGSVTVE